MNYEEKTTDDICDMDEILTCVIRIMGLCNYTSWRSPFINLDFMGWTRLFWNPGAFFSSWPVSTICYSFHTTWEHINISQAALVEDVSFPKVGTNIHLFHGRVTNWFWRLISACSAGNGAWLDWSSKKKGGCCWRIHLAKWLALWILFKYVYTYNYIYTL